MRLCPKKETGNTIRQLRRLRLKIIYLAEIAFEEFAKFTKFVQLINSDLGSRCIMVIRNSRNRQEEAV